MTLAVMASHGTGAALATRVQLFYGTVFLEDYIVEVDNDLKNNNIQL